MPLFYTTSWHNSCGLASLAHFLTLPENVSQTASNKTLLATFAKVYDFYSLTPAGFEALMAHYVNPVDKQLVFVPVLRKSLKQALYKDKAYQQSFFHVFEASLRQFIDTEEAPEEPAYLSLFHANHHYYCARLAESTGQNLPALMKDAKSYWDKEGYDNYVKYVSDIEKCAMLTFEELAVLAKTLKITLQNEPSTQKFGYLAEDSLGLLRLQHSLNHWQPYSPKISQVSCDDKKRLLPQRLKETTPTQLKAQVNQTLANLTLRHTSDDTPLHTALRKGHLKRVKGLLADDLTTPNAMGVTPFHLICYKNQRALLNQVALHVHESYNQYGYFECWFSGKKFDLSQLDMRGFTGLHYLAGFGDTRTLKQLLSLNGIATLLPSKALATPLDIAITYHKQNNTLLLLDKLGSLNTADAKGLKPVHYAATANDVPLLKALSDKGASLSVKDYKGNLPLHLAAKHHATETLDHLYQHTNALKTDYKNSNRVYRFGWRLWSGKPHMKPKNHKNLTPAMLALKSPHMEAILKKYSDDIGPKDFNELLSSTITPKKDATQAHINRQYTWLAYLLEKPTYQHQLLAFKDKDNNNFLHLCVKTHQLTLARVALYALKTKASHLIHAKNKQGQTPLMLLDEEKKPNNLATLEPLERLIAHCSNKAYHERYPTLLAKAQFEALWTQDMRQALMSDNWYQRASMGFMIVWPLYKALQILASTMNPWLAVETFLLELFGVDAADTIERVLQYARTYLPEESESLAKHFAIKGVQGLHNIAWFVGFCRHTANRVCVELARQGVSAAVGANEIGSNYFTYRKCAAFGLAVGEVGGRLLLAPEVEKYWNSIEQTLVDRLDVPSTDELLTRAGNSLNDTLTTYTRINLKAFLIKSYEQVREHVGGVKPNWKIYDEELAPILQDQLANQPQATQTGVQEAAKLLFTHQVKDWATKIEALVNYAILGTFNETTLSALQNVAALEAKAGANFGESFAKHFMLNVDYQGIVKDSRLASLQKDIAKEANGLKKSNDTQKWQAFTQKHNLTLKSTYTVHRKSAQEMANDVKNKFGEGVSKKDAASGFAGAFIANYPHYFSGLSEEELINVNLILYNYFIKQPNHKFDEKIFIDAANDLQGLFIIDLYQGELFNKTADASVYEQLNDFSAVGVRAAWGAVGTQYYLQDAEGYRMMSQSEQIKLFKELYDKQGHGDQNKPYPRLTHTVNQAFLDHKTTTEIPDIKGIGPAGIADQLCMNAEDVATRKIPELAGMEPRDFEPKLKPMWKKALKHTGEIQLGVSLSTDLKSFSFNTTDSRGNIYNQYPIYKSSNQSPNIFNNSNACCHTPSTVPMTVSVR